MFDGFIDKLKVLDLEGWDRTALVGAAADAGRARSALDVVDVRIAAALAGLEDGVGAAHELRNARRCSKREAQRIVDRAEGLKDLPSVQEALRAGDITVEHADALARAAADTSAEAVEQGGLVGRFAKGRPADIANKDIRDWAGRHQRGADKEAKHRRQRKARKLSMFTGDGDMKILYGQFDPVTGAQIEAELNTETDRLYRLDGGRDGAIKVRSDEQRRADALHNIVTGQRQGETGGAPAIRRGETASRPQIVIAVDADVIVGDDPHGRCEIPGLGPLPKSALERLACDADLFGAVFSKEGDPLWMSRGTRTVTPAQYRALIVRDGGCVICAAIPNHCEAHHIMAWSPPARGPTDIDNLALLCIRHHHDLHDHGLTLTRRPDNHWEMGRAPPQVQRPRES